MEDYNTIKYRKCCLGFLKCEDCAFKGNCKERFNYRCMANFYSEHLYGNDKNYHVMLCEKDKFEELDEKDKEGFISYLTELYNFLYNADILDCPMPPNIISNNNKKVIEKKLESIADWAECMKITLCLKCSNEGDDVTPLYNILRLVKEIKDLLNTIED